ncbi:MAG: hypothetical protein WC881_01420 [Elusimicrobiota bacterium]
MSKLPYWAHVSKPHHAGLQAFLLGVLVGVFLAVMPWGHLARFLGSRAGKVQERHQERIGMEPRIQEASSLNLTYEQISAQPLAYGGKYVLWCVDHPSAGTSFLEGRPAQPLVWSNDEQLPINSVTSGGRCTRVLALVEGTGPAGVQLRFIGLP